jgi:hypothetical protein
MTALQAIEYLKLDDVTPEMVRDWVRRDLLAPAHRVRGTNVFRLDAFMEAERKTRVAGSGRPRRDAADLTEPRENVTISRTHVTLVDAGQVRLSSHRCTVVKRNGRDCNGFVPASAPIPVCADHLREAFLWYADQITANREGRGEGPAPNRIGAAPRPAALPGPGEGFVYYVRFGDRIKIGFSESVKDRLQAVPHDELLAVEPGPMELERMRHRQFASLLVARREWFRHGAELLSHIAMLREHYGEPDLDLIPPPQSAPHELPSAQYAGQCPACGRRSLQRQVDPRTMEYGPARCVTSSCSKQ